MNYIIHNWDDIKDHFEDSTLILGNGASRNVSEDFNYKNLKKEAEDRGLLSQDVLKLFKTFDTTDFELILRTLFYANLVNVDLGIKDNQSTRAYKSISNALITLVRDVHSNYAKVNFKNIGKFIENFSFIFPLNYDLIIYWTILYLNENNKNNVYKDCFGYGGKFNKSLFSERYPENNKTSRIVAYPHGMLALNKNKTGQELKVARKKPDGDNLSCELLEEILSNWESQEYSPIFVSEGTSGKKIETIERSRYLNTVYKEYIPNALIPSTTFERKNPKNLTIFGWALGEQDEHIIKALISKVRGDSLNNMKIAYSVSSKYKQEQLAGLDLKIKKIFKIKTWNSDKKDYEYLDIKNLEILFFDRDSLGSWKNNAI
ncbi:DUF4917 family protein [Acinetobacter qingfengensis]|uniref:Uncharacterized protein n=1 Tax=Acinetobacter qingfengensis TaxID=1262585 RepID=A0A1E7RCN7_9GAMM|nr:DUF4917 family protein [Acinetobacter qingfengensis]KAA8734896.1 DUF4917 family protein [Acinetobacter qingfengensis]OEY96935.1 hypothetical protein BJI46_11675 [Acinetobacter qingfengensis]